MTDKSMAKRTIQNNVSDNDFKIEPQLNITQDENSLEYIEISNDLATAKIALQGGHIISWQPKAQEHPVLWVSSNARYQKGRSIRGGVPICWPWFGAHPTDGTLCPHGFARVIPWQLIMAEPTRRGATRIVLQMTETAEARRQLSYPYLLSMTITVGDTLRIELSTTNKSTHPFLVGEAFHTYFNISDIANVTVTGLQDTLFADKVFDYERRLQRGDITFNGEFDRVYLNTTSDSVIEDTGLNRQIRIGTSRSQSTIVWTPWVDKAEQMTDMGTKDEWRRTVCVETGNALDNAVVISPNKTHTMAVEYSVEEL